MDLHHLRVFAAVFKNKSFSRASEELRLSQPTVSDHIKSLEEYLGCRLFDRLGRNIVPTNEAEALYHRACEIIEKMESIREIAGRAGGELTGELIIGASTIPGTYLLPPVMMDFKRLNPGIFFKIEIADSRETVQKILSHGLLIGIVGSKQFSHNLNYTQFVDDELVAVASPELSIKNRISLDELLSYPMICREEGSGTRKEFERYLDLHGKSFDKMNIVGYFGSTDAIKQAVKTGAALAVISRFAVAEDLKHGTLKLIRVSGDEIKRQFYVVTHRKRTLPALHTAFLAFLNTSL
ncbi:MAG: LysR family transcriptional regulator [Nitrospirae bacterium]|nr:LysR family transcriptional regulator [Nitrospirota bacterium]